MPDETRHGNEDVPEIVKQACRMLDVRRNLDPDRILPAAFPDGTRYEIPAWCRHLSDVHTVLGSVGWQPIATAPIGEVVLVCWLDTGEYDTIESAQFNSAHRFWSCRGNLRKFDPEQPHAWPSHWMPTPLLPVVKIPPNTEELADVGQ